jgi:hypothetical protein
MGRRDAQKSNKEIRMSSLALTGPSVPSEHEMMVYRTMADHAVSSKMYKSIGEKAGVMMIMLAARELGIAPMSALNGGLNIINGKVEISARMMSGLIRKSGHTIQVKECTDTHCVLVGRRKDTNEVQESSFSVAEAQRAGLIKQGGGWTKFPKDMCFARALSRLSRQLFSDVIGMGYVEGEISQQDVKMEEAPQVYDIQQEVIEQQDANENLHKLLIKFDPSEIPKLETYITVVQKHFDWTREQTIIKFLEEPNIIEKFNAWKSKQGEAA